MKVWCMENNKIKYWGIRYKCNICNSYVRIMFPSGGKEKIFKEESIIGAGYREHVICPVCKSKDRFRFVYYVLEQYTNIFSTSGKILHFAPESMIQSKILENHKCKYVSCDLNGRKARYIVDIENIQFKDNEFDYIICNYVLQYVDDKKALDELKRVLKPGGKIILSVPISRKNEKTKEFIPSRQIGESYYRRFYGKDVKKRLEDYTNLNVKKYQCKNDRYAHKYGWIIGDTVFIMEK